jgi:hypothetical protein
LGSKKEDNIEKVEAKEEPKADAAAPVEATETAAVEAAVEAPAAEAAVVEEAAAPEVRPAASKRHSSLFDFKSRFGSKKPAAESTPAVPAKDEEAVTSTEAPVIPAVEQSEPLATSIETPATVPAEAVTNDEPVAEVAAEPTKAEKRKSALPFGFGQKKEKATEAEGEKPLSPFAKLRQTVKGKSSKTAEKPVETEVPAAVEGTEANVEAAEEPIVAAPIQASTPVVSATA